jgi:L,D-transpeptidase YcbB
VKTLAPLALALLMSACFNVQKPAQNAAFIEPVLIDSVFIGNFNLQCAASVQYFYALNNNELRWFDSAQLAKHAKEFAVAIQAIQLKGLNPADYNSKTLALKLADTVLDKSAKKEIDVLLTDAFFALYQHLHHGRVDPSRKQWMSLNQTIDSGAVAALLADQKEKNVINTLEAREPQTTEYRALRDTLTMIWQQREIDSLSQVKIAKLELTLERLRWVKHRPERYLSVNIPAFELTVFESDSIVFASKVIVGRIESKTPQLQSVIKSFIIYPYWHVPRRIATDELLPHIQRDTTYLERNNFEVLNTANEIVSAESIDWSTLNSHYFPYVLRQREGRDNSLGIIKFVFSSEYGVYLHDTNSRRLFKKEKRAFSHGCVRVEKAVELAHYLVKDDSVYTTPADLEQYLDLKQRLQLKVVNPLPLFIEYYTCVFKDGSVLYYTDVYGDDVLLQQALKREQEHPSL